MNKIPDTKLKELGEFKLIDQLTNSFSLHHKSSIRGVGDDAAVLLHTDVQQLVSTHMLLEGIHFDLAYCPLRHLGYKSVVSSISNIVAMNGKPTQIVIGLGVSNRFTLETLQELYTGIGHACKQYDIDLVGGDTSPSVSGLVLSITTIGYVELDRIVYRNTAKPHDVICVSGDLGASYIGLQILEREKQVLLADKEMKPDLDIYTYMLQRQLRPEARIDILQDLHNLGLKPTAMLDITDGLASELFQLSKASKVGVCIYEDRLPIDHRAYKTAVQLHLDPIMCAMNGGEDYELLFTLSVSDAEKTCSHPDITPIGYTTSIDKGCEMITKSGSNIPLTDPGHV